MPLNTTEQQIIKGTTGTLVSYPPPPLAGPPSAVTVRLNTPNQQMPAAGVSATADAVSQTTTGTTSRGATSIALSGAATFVAGRKYLLTDATTGERVVVEAQKSGSSSTLYLAAPLDMDLASGSAVQGFAVTYPIDTTQSATEGRGVAIWEATVGGVTVRWRQDLRIVLAYAAPQLQASDIAMLSPYSVRLKPPDDKSWGDTLDSVWRLEVVPMLMAKGIKPERIVSWEPVNALYIAALESFLAENYETEPEKAEAKAKRYATKQALTFANVRLWYDESDDLGRPGESTEDAAARGFDVSFASR
jgi:hypothetical protein